MKSKLEIENRRDALQLEAQRISSQIDEVDKKINEIPKGLYREYLRKPLIKEKEVLQVWLGIINSRWAEMMWMLNE